MPSSNASTKQLLDSAITLQAAFELSRLDREKLEVWKSLAVVGPNPADDSR